jgi:hypothetical protein
MTYLVQFDHMGSADARLRSIVGVSLHTVNLVAEDGSYGSGVASQFIGNDRSGSVPVVRKNSVDALAHARERFANLSQSAPIYFAHYRTGVRVSSQRMRIADREFNGMGNFVSRFDLPKIRTVKERHPGER